MHTYGINESRAEWWVHICPSSRELYAYQREEMIAAMREKQFPQREIPSAIGRLVPKGQPFIRRFDLPAHLFLDIGPAGFASDSEAGKACEKVFERWVNQYGLFPPTRRAVPQDDIAVQYTGIDFVIETLTSWPSVEVKCDDRIGETGNLFVQTHEQHHQWSERHGHRQRVS